ncbi:MAG: 50S ribosomal protein L5 [bacterium]
MTSFNLKKHYKEKVVDNLKKKFDISNVMAIPKLDKIVINRGLGEATVTPALIETSVNQFITLTGQKPILRKSKKAISNFKLRENQIIGCKVTLRRDKMYEFLSKFINLSAAKIRDFRGFSDSFDKDGNITIGIRESESIFPELSGTSVDKPLGLSITIVTTAKNKEQAKYLLTEMGFPFRKK